MKQSLSKSKIRSIRQHCLNKVSTNAAFAVQLGVSYPMIYKYNREFHAMGVRYPQHRNDINFFVPPAKRRDVPTKLWVAFTDSLPALIEQTTAKKLNVPVLWNAYHLLYPQGYTLHTFKLYFGRLQQKHPICLYVHKKIRHIPDEDMVILQQWYLGFNHDLWTRAVLVKESYAGTPLAAIAVQVKLTVRTLQKWIELYKQGGLKGLQRKRGLTHEHWVAPRKERISNLMKLIHETPKLHGINRASWRLSDLSTAYYNLYGDPVSSSAIRIYLKQSGYVFKKARMVLTSSDPLFREKLNHMKSILSALKEDEKFFSVDEFGPCAIKMKQGWSFVPSDAPRSVRENQRSKGWFICTAALELSTNQVTHFYSMAKNTEEMMKLITQLLLQYPTQKKLYISWDAAAWHSSKQLKAFITKINIYAASSEYSMPAVEIVPLPSSAQFLNVIESVFSGLAKSVIHNSDYASVDECKAAISRHFEERNAYFLKHPKKAGSMIWGKELVKPVFDETNNCKDPKYS